MRSSRSKVLHEVAGMPVISHVVTTAMQAECDFVAVVTGRNAEAVGEAVHGIMPQVSLHGQTERLGTAHAVLAARQALEKGHDDILVLFGDTPLLRPQTLKSMRDRISDGNAVVVLGFETDDPTGYGRLVQADGKLLAIREHKDASEEERAITLCNGGLMGFAGETALELLDAIDNANSKGEYYLTDIVEIANAKGLKVSAMVADEDELMGINTRAELAKAETLWQSRRRRQIMLSGVSMTAPETVFLSHDTEIGQETLIEPNVIFAPGVKIGEGVTIKAFSYLEGSRISDNAVIGPYARLRPGTELAANTKVGNFVEIKKAKVGEGAKVNHLTYLGDAEIGPGANIGAGTITCNYDGMNKHLTRIGASAFIGSNTALVAPVTVGDGAYIASGSVITGDVPEDAMGIGRARQANKDGYAKLIRERTAQEKARRSG